MVVLFVSVLFFCLDEDYIPGWGECGRPLRLLLGDLPLMVKGYLCSTATGLLGRTALGAKKNCCISTKSSVRQIHTVFRSVCETSGFSFMVLDFCESQVV